jgi:dTDP-4-dehydrorhamnose reductase
MRRIVITGGSGLLAVNWYLENAHENHFILGMNSKMINVEKAETFLSDLSSADACKRQFEKLRPSLVIHTVAITNIEKCEENPELAEEVNTQMALNVAEACRYFNIPLVHISTDQLFNGNQSFYSEEDATCPLNIYGATKRRAETGVLDMHEKAIVVRTNFFGWGPTYRRSFSDFIIRSLRAGQEIRLFNDVFYTPIVISELVDVIMQLVEKEKYGLFNVVGSERLSKYDFGVNLAKTFALDKTLIQSVEIGSVNNLVKRPLDMSLSNSKVNASLDKKIGSMQSFIEHLVKQESAGFVQTVEKIDQ